MQDPENPNKNGPLHTTLTRSQIITVWIGLSGAALGCSAWMLAMAAMGGDWIAFGLTVGIDVLVIFVFGKLSLRRPTWRFPLLAALIVGITAHCLAMYWWRYELWRGGGVITAAELLREKEVLSFTIAAMVAIVLAQFVVVYLLQANSRKNRKKLRSKH